MARRRALYASAAVLVVAFVALALPWATREKPRVTATPAPPSLYREVGVRLAPGARACVAPVVVSRSTRRASFLVRGTGGEGPALRVEVHGRGYASQADVAGGYRNGPLDAALRAPARDVLTTLCITDAGRRGVLLAGTPEPRRATTRIGGRPAHASLDGARVPANVVLTLEEARPRSNARYARGVLDHLTAFRPGIVSPAVAAVLLILTVLLAAVGAPWAYARALSDDDDRRSTE